MKVRGYAYSGGGQAVIRVDVSADDGATWTTANLEPIQKRRYRSAVSVCMYVCALLLHDAVYGIHFPCQNLPDLLCS